MATAAQVTANRLNAQLATGPTSAQGKSTSSRNATRHGLSAATFHVLIHEDQAEFDQITAGLKTEHGPVTRYESFLVEQLSRSWWLLSRAQRLEAKAFDYMAGSPLPVDDPDVIVITRLFELNPNTLQTFQRHVDKAEKSFYRARRELKAAQENRIAAEAAEGAQPAAQPETQPVAETKKNEPNSPVEYSKPANRPLTFAANSVATCYTIDPDLRYNSGVNDPEVRFMTATGGRQ